MSTCWSSAEAFRGTCKDNFGKQSLVEGGRDGADAAPNTILTPNLEGYTRTMERTITTTVELAGSSPVEVTKIIPIPPVVTTLESTSTTTVQLADSAPAVVTSIAGRVVKQ